MRPCTMQNFSIITEPWRLHHKLTFSEHVGEILTHCYFKLHTRKTCHSLIHVYMKLKPPDSDACFIFKHKGALRLETLLRRTNPIPYLPVGYSGLC